MKVGGLDKCNKYLMKFSIPSLIACQGNNNNKVETTVAVTDVNCTIVHLVGAAHSLQYSNKNKRLQSFFYISSHSFYKTVSVQSPGIQSLKTILLC